MKRVSSILPRIIWIIVPTLACDAGPRSAEAKEAEPAPVAAAAAEANPASADEEPSTAVEVPASGIAAQARGGGLTITAHTVINPPRAATDKENYWIQYQVYGEIQNDTQQTFETVSGRITFHDGSGAMLGIDSIGTAVKQDVGDDSPGETIFADVHFVKPGQSVPFHFTRNLAAVKGVIAKHELHPRRATVATDPPDGVAVDVKESFEGEGYMRKRMFAGLIRNDGDGGCRSPALVVAFLDDAGKIADLESFDATDDLKKTLAKGESIPFQGGVYVTAENAWKEKAAVKTWVDCEPVW